MWGDRNLIGANVQQQNPHVSIPMRCYRTSHLKSVHAHPVEHAQYVAISSTAQGLFEAMLMSSKGDYERVVFVHLSRLVKDFPFYLVDCIISTSSRRCRLLETINTSLKS